MIEPVFEANFLDSSYGFRPKRDAKQATEKVKKTRKDAELAFEHLKRIMTRLKLTLNPQKTKIVDMNKGDEEGKGCN